MTEHLSGMLAFLTSKIGGLIGFFSGLITVTTANAEISIDVMQFVVFSIGPVQFPVQSILTIVGAITTSIFFVAQMWALAKGRTAEQQLVEDVRELQEELNDLKEE